MAARKGVAQHGGGYRRRYLRLCAVWRGRLREAYGAVSGVGLALIQREALCLGVAMIFCTTVVIPFVLIFGDRSLPFVYVDTTIVEKAAKPGDRVHVRLIVRGVSKTCKGHVERVFIDSSNKVYPMPGKRTAYQYFPDRGGTGGLRIVEREWTVPLDAKPGEGTYSSFPEFWCYPLQFIYPIKAPPLRARLVVLPSDVPVPPGSGVTLTPQGGTLVVPRDSVR